MRCLDCLPIVNRGDNDCTSLMTTSSDVNDEVKQKINLLDREGYTLTQICKELQLLYGNHIISNRRDRYSRSQFAY